MLLCLALAGCATSTDGTSTVANEPCHAEPTTGSRIPRCGGSGSSNVTTGAFPAGSVVPSAGGAR